MAAVPRAATFKPCATCGHAPTPPPPLASIPRGSIPWGPVYTSPPIPFPSPIDLLNRLERLEASNDTLKDVVNKLILQLDARLPAEDGTAAAAEHGQAPAPSG